MKIKLLTTNTLPSNRDKFWQFVTVPTVSVYRSFCKQNPYTSVMFELFFWSFAVLVSKNNGDD